MYGSPVEIKRIQSKLRQIGHSSPHRVATTGHDEHSSIRKSSRSAGTHTVSSIDQDAGRNTEQNIGQDTRQQIGQDANQGIGQSSLQNTRDGHPAATLPVRSTPPVSNLEPDPLYPSQATAQVTTQPTPNGTLAPSMAAASIQSSGGQGGQPRNLYSSRAGQQALATMAAVVPARDNHPPSVSNADIQMHGSAHAAISDPSASQRAYALASELRQHSAGNGHRQRSRDRSTERFAAQAAVAPSGITAAHPPIRRSVRASGRSLYALGEQARAIGSQVFRRLLRQWIHPDTVQIRGRLSLSVALRWFVGAVIARLVIDAVLELFATPFLFMVILTLLLTPIVLTLYQTAIDPPSTAQSIRRILIVLVGLLLGGQLF